MMDFYDFCQEVKDSITQYLPAEFETARVELVNNTKANVGSKTGIAVCKEGARIAPCLYLEEAYEQYQMGFPFSRIMNQIADTIRHSYTVDIKKMKPDDFAEVANASWEDIKDKVIVAAVGTTRNSFLLQDVPHVTMGDISATYRIALMMDGNYSATVLIDNRMMDRLGIDKYQLHNTAVKNTMERQPATCASIGQVICDIVGDDEFSIGDTSGLYVLTNADRFCGASTVFYPGVMEKINEAFPEGIYILPSSIHEVLIVSKNLADKQALTFMVKEINAAEVSPEEQLSDYVHEYDPKTKELFVDGMSREMKKTEPERIDKSL